MTASRPARAFVLVALLFVAGLQVVEAGHDHSAEHSIRQCLLCKVSVDAVVAAAAPGLPVAPAAEWAPQTASVPLCPGDRAPFDARGPPRYS